MNTNYRQIIDINVNSVEKRYFPTKHYVYGVLVTWPDSTESKVFRKYSHFCDLKRELDKSIAKELCDFLPEPSEKKYLGRFEKFSQAITRKEYIINFCKTILMDHQAHLCCSEIISAFFEPKGQDLRSVVQISLPIKTQEYVCSHDFKGETESELSVFRNQKVAVHQKNLNGWWFVSSCYGQGYVPQAVLKCCCEVGDDQEIILAGFDEFCEVLRDYKGIKLDEIDLKKGEFVRVKVKRLSGWWTIENNGRTGIAPAVCLINLVRKNSISSSESLNGSAKSEFSTINSMISQSQLLENESGLNDILITKF
ncbi:SH3 and PX domain-containing 2A isoform X2 [Brachionus plicatilis]|uniref:SH3 and PX domain-containing 2A isoform X2 n=1 Tax=Brachionus plicatilis TaxID=10195 RepID=A0A3M7RD66_BRAPC|nr:SH3 and PX domain-containing 2A isoform X2 [Brachionus plicatilis]